MQPGLSPLAYSNRIHRDILASFSEILYKLFVNTKQKLSILTITYYPVSHTIGIVYTTVQFRCCLWLLCVCVVIVFHKQKLNTPLLATLVWSKTGFPVLAHPMGC